MVTVLIESIETHFREVKDPIIVTKNQSPLFIDILVIAMCGAINGVNYWTGVAVYGWAKEA